MAIKFFRAPALPATPTNNDNGIWFVKANGNHPMKLYVLNNGNIIPLDAIDAAGLASALALKADDNAVVKLAGAQTITGKKTFSAVPELNADAATANEAVRKSQMDSELANKANDNAVVKLTGNQSISGSKTFSTPPSITSDASTGNHAIRKSQLDALLSVINDALGDLETAIADGMAPPVDIDCSSNPNYPAASVGDRFIVSGDGKIGGASGEEVTVGDLIVCKVANSGGTHATVGDKFYILQTNIHDATTTVKGYIQLATQSEVNTGTNNKKAVTPETLRVRLEALVTVLQTDVLNISEQRYVRYDQSQSLTTTQKNNARNNIEAAKESEVVKITGNQSISGTKTFTTPPTLNADASSGSQAVRKSQMDAGLASKADDNSVVKLTGAQTIAGKKTFSSVPASNQDATGDNDLVRKSQVDAMVASAVLEWSIDNWS